MKNRAYIHIFGENKTWKFATLVFALLAPLFLLTPAANAGIMTNTYCAISLGTDVSIQPNSPAFTYEVEYAVAFNQDFAGLSHLTSPNFPNDAGGVYTSDHTDLIGSNDRFNGMSIYYNTNYMPDGSIIFLVQTGFGGPANHSIYYFNNPAWHFPQFTVSEGSSRYVHIAVVRNATGQMSIFYDGQAASRSGKETPVLNGPFKWQPQSFVNNDDVYTNFTYLGHDSTYNTDANVKSYVSNLRFVRGTALYDPTATSITPPTVQQLGSVAPHQISSLGTITGGTGYTNGSYTDVTMTLASGKAATTYPKATIVVAGGAVKSVIITGTGSNVGTDVDTTTVLTAPPTSIGGTGSGFTVPVATVSDTPILLNSLTAPTVVKNSGDAGLPDASTFDFSGRVTGCPANVTDSFIGGIGIYNIYYADGSIRSDSGQFSKPRDYYDSNAPVQQLNLPTVGTAVKSGYHLDSWNTNPDGSGTKYAIGATLPSPTGNKTYYAQWAIGAPPQIKPITIAASSPTVTYGASIPTITPSVTSGTLTNPDTATSIGVTCSITPAYDPATSSVGDIFATNCTGGNTSIYSFTYTPGSFTVAKSALAITASSPTVTYGSAVPTITASVISGTLKSPDSPASLGITCTISPAYDPATSSVGDIFATNCTGGGDLSNYSYSYTSGSFTVAKSPVTITASSPIVTLGSSIPTITASLTSGLLKSPDSLISLRVVCSISPAYDPTTSKVGDVFATNCSSGDTTNYSYTYSPGTFTVAKAALTITASSPYVSFGSAVPTITPSLTSGKLQGADTLTSLNITCSISPTYSPATSKVGNVFVTNCSGGDTTNYSYTYTPGTFKLVDEPSAPYVDPTPIKPAAPLIVSTTNPVDQVIKPTTGGEISAQIVTSLAEKPGVIKLVVPSGAIASPQGSADSGGISFTISEPTMNNITSTSNALAFSITAKDNVTGANITEFLKPLILNFPFTQGTSVSTTTSTIILDGIPAWSRDGLSWTPMPLLSTPVLPDNLNDGYFINSDGTISIFTRHLTLFGLRIKQPKLSIFATENNVERSKSTQIKFNGGAGSSLINYQISTPQFCSINSSGLLTALSAGTCGVFAQKLGSEIYLDSKSDVLNISITEPEVSPVTPAQAAPAPTPAPVNTQKVTPRPAKISKKSLLVQAVTYNYVRLTVQLGKAFGNKTVTVEILPKVSGAPIFKHDVNLNSSGIGMYTTSELKFHNLKGQVARLMLGGRVIKSVKI